MITQPLFNASLVNLLRFLISSHFSHDNYCTVVYYDANLTNSMGVCQQQCQYLAALEQAVSRSVSTSNASIVWIAAGAGFEAVNIKNAIEQGCQSYITVTRFVMNFLKLKLKLKENSDQRFHDKYFLIFSENITFLENSETTREAFKFYPNLWFMVPSSAEGYDFYTPDYSISDSVRTSKVNSFVFPEQDFINKTNLFYDKLFNLQGRTIPMGVTEYLPYCKAHYVEANTGNVNAFNSSFPKELELEGLEGSLLVEFCQARNCNIKLWPFGPSQWGDIYDNGSGYGLMYATYAKETELSICCVYNNWFTDLLDTSQYIAKSTMFLLVPGAKLLPTALTPIYPFKATLWQAIFLMLAIMTGVHHVVTGLNQTYSLNTASRKPPIEKSIFDMISIYLDQGIFPNSTSSSYRVLVSIILLSGVVLSNSYCGGLASVLTIPMYEKSLETNHDFVQTAYRWGAPAVAWIFSLYGADSLDIQAIVRQFDEVPDENQLYKKSLSREYGIGLELLNSGSYTFGSYVREDNVRSFDILKESLYFAYTVAYTQRGWPLMEYFNKFALEAIQHGMLIHWEKRTLRKYQSTRVEQALQQIANGCKEDEELQDLTVQHIVGPMCLLLFGTVLALTIFIGEVVWHSLKTTRSNVRLILIGRFSGYMV